jgi:hypothetical protein
MAQKNSEKIGKKLAENGTIWRFFEDRKRDFAVHQSGSMSITNGYAVEFCACGARLDQVAKAPRVRPRSDIFTSMTSDPRARARRDLTIALI